MSYKSVLALMLTVGMATSTLVAQEADPVRRPGAKQDAGVLDAKTSGASVRASVLIGKNIVNPQGESVGEIADLVLDTRSGEVRYVAVTYGGLLGIGNKMYAVPFEAFKVQRDPNDPDDADDFALVLNVTQKQLEGDPGFDEDHWPNFADPKFREQLYQRYNVKPYWMGRERGRDRGVHAGGGLNIDVDRDGVDIDLNRRDKKRDK